MKKLLISALALIMLAAAVCGCSGNADIELDVFAAGARLRDGCTFQYPIEQVENTAAVDILAIDETLAAKGDSGIMLYYARNSETPEQIVVIEAADEAAAKKINDGNLKKHINYYIEGYSTYGPDQVPKIESCVNRVVGRYVFLIICSDNTAAGKLLDTILDEAAK